MTEDTKTALAIVEEAMAVEQEGSLFYLRAARNTSDKKGQEMLTTLANDEQKHYELLKRQHISLMSEGNFVSSYEIKPVDIDLGMTLFPRGRESLEKAAHTISSDWDALLFGLDIENRSYDFYREAALKLDNPLGKQMFKFLAGQEESHFEILMMRCDALFGPISWQA